MSSGVSAKIDLLLARDGNQCWYCDKPINFELRSPSKLAGTLEHLVAKSLGGKSTLDNLALCHAKCNAHLRDHPYATKLKMREAERRNREKQVSRKVSSGASAVAQSKPVATTHATEKPAKQAVAKSPSPFDASANEKQPIADAGKEVIQPPASKASVSPSLAVVSALQPKHPARTGQPTVARLTPIQRWQVFGLAAAATAFFLAGLCLGLLLH